MATLKSQLDAIRRGAEGDGTKPGRIPSDALAIMHRVTVDQRASGFQSRMPAVGQPAPSFELPDQDGAIVSSGALLARGPLVVSFFRGGW
jgi:hypothetical protein